MKKLAFLVLILAFLSPSITEAQKANLTTQITKVGGATYIEREKFVPGFPEYKIFSDNTPFADSLMKIVATAVEGAETSFGFPRAKIVEKLHFVECEDKGFSNPSLTGELFISTILESRSKYVARYEKHIELDLELTSRHETFHLLDYELGLTNDSAIVEFMETPGMKKLFDFVYIELSQNECFFQEEVKRYENNKMVEIGVETNVDYQMTGKELFAHVFGTLDSYCWEKKVFELKLADQTTFDLYLESLELLHSSIEGKIHGNPPVIKLLNHRIYQMRNTK